MKRILFHGRTLDVIRAFPEVVRHEVGHQLERVQRGLFPLDWKPMSTIGCGVREIRIHAGGQYRVIYITKYKDAVHVLHAFNKKTRITSKHDIKMARDALRRIQTRYRK